MKTIHFSSIDSTNSYLKKEGKNLPNLTFVTADFQTNGKGRNDRIWESKANENILFSYLIKDPFLIKKFSSLSLYSAMIVAKLLEEIGIKNVSIKWPNDVYVNDKKICGILLEGSIPDYVVVGVGINYGQKNFKNPLRHEATCIKSEIEKCESLEFYREVLCNIFNVFWINFPLDEDGYEEFINSHNYLKGKDVKIESLNLEGLVLGISKDNELIVETKEGIKNINSGEVIIK